VGRIYSTQGDDKDSYRLLVPASYPMGTGGPFPGGKARPGRDVDHSTPFSAEVKYERSYTSSSPMRLHGV
jgi:hypothetical protein